MKSPKQLSHPVPEKRTSLGRVIALSLTGLALVVVAFVYVRWWAPLVLAVVLVLIVWQERQLVRERERSIEELRKSEDRYARAMRGTNDGLWDWDLVTDDYYISSRFRELVGLSDDDLLRGSEMFLERVHPDDRERLDAALKDHFDGHAPFSVQLRLRRPDGTYRWFWPRGEVTRDESGKPIRIAGAITDITEARNANEQLRLFREAFEQSHDLILVIDVDARRIVDSNAAAQAAMGYTAEEMLELDPLAISVDISEVEAWNARVAAIRSGFGRRRRTAIVRKDGSVFPVEVSTSSISSGEHDLLLAIIRDITERVHDEEERTRLQEQFMHSQRLESVGRLAGGVAHDFNNLVTVINNAAEMASKEITPDSPIHTDLKHIREAGDRAALLTKQLLAFSKQQVLRPELLDMNEVVTHFLTLIRRVIGEDIRINVHTHDGAAIVKADRGQLEQVLMNLSLNARDAMQHGGELTIEVDVVKLTGRDIVDHPNMQPGRYVRLSVIDEGEGMPADVKAQVFEPFFTTKEQGRGTGLGLPSVYGIVQQSGGFVTIDSAKNSGTIVRVYLPPTAGEAASAPTPKPVVSAQGSETVLIVEDEQAIRFVLRRVLEVAGYTVLEAPDGIAARELLESLDTLPDLVMTDLVMPRMSGIELAREIRLRWPQIPILLASGYSEEMLTSAFDEVHEWRLITKPYSANELLDEIRSILDAQHV